MNEIRVVEGYSHWRVPRSPGIAGLDLAGSVLLIGGVLLVIVTIMFGGLWLALGMLVILGVALAMMMVKDRHGINGVARVSTRMAWRSTRRSGARQYRSGPLGKTLHGGCELPGLLSKTELSEFNDSWGQPFAVLSLPTRGHYAIVFSVQPEGGSLVDHDQQEQWVARYGMALSQLGEENGVIGCQVTVETGPDSGRELHDQVVRRLDPNAPELARRALMELTETYPASSCRLGINDFRRAGLGSSLTTRTSSGSMSSRPMVRLTLTGSLTGCLMINEPRWLSGCSRSGITRRSLRTCRDAGGCAWPGRPRAPRAEVGSLGQGPPVRR